MKVYFLLIIMNAKELFRELKRNLLFFFLPIAIFIGFFSYYQYNKVELTFIKPIVVGVIVREESIYGQMLVDDFNSKKELSKFFRITQDDSDTLQEQFDKKVIDALVTIPKGFVASLMNFEYLPIEVVMHQDDPVKTVILYQGFRGYERYIQSVEKSITAFYDNFYAVADETTYWQYNDALSIDLIMTVLQRTDMYALDKIVDIPSALSMDYYFIALSILFVLYIAMMQTINLITERKKQVFQRLMTTRVSVTAYLLAKLSAMIVMLLIYLFLWTGMYSVLTKQPFFYQGKLLFIMAVCITIAVECAVLLSLTMHKEQSYFMITSMIVFFNAVVGGSIIPIHYMPESLKIIAKWTPNFQWIKYVLFLKNDIAYEHELLGIVSLLLVIVLLFISSVSGYKRVLGKGGLL